MMKCKATKVLFEMIASALFLISCQPLQQAREKPIALHPENPNYFIYKGKPTILVTSAEHYGAVMNTAFDYKRYLQTIKNAGLNYTRIFTGPYSEIGDKTFGIQNNTMNPEQDKYLVQWARDASGKYNLDAWNPAYFERLKSFVAEAEKLGIVVEVTLYTSYYSDHQWSMSPFNPKNNIQQLDTINYKLLNTTDCGKFMKYHETYVRKMVQELNPFGNFHFEIQNEPWSDNPQLVETIVETDTTTHTRSWQKIVEIAKPASLDWQKQIAQIIVDEETKLPNKHLIAQNISNFRARVDQPDPNISIFNFHYAYPEAVSLNNNLSKVRGLDETGFMPKEDILYRSQAWKFMLAGGALYNNLDYSFTVGHEDGTHIIDTLTPGWGHPELRRQLKFMKEFIEGFNFISMKPDSSVLTIAAGKVGHFQVLTEPGKQYALYLQSIENANIKLVVPDGSYTVAKYNPVTGTKEGEETKQSKDGSIVIEVPGAVQDLVFQIIAK